jgi:hypothetical protein
MSSLIAREFWDDNLEYADLAAPLSGRYKAASSRRTPNATRFTFRVFLSNFACAQMSELQKVRRMEGQPLAAILFRALQADRFWPLDGRRVSRAGTAN